MLVLDASVAIKWFTDEPGSDAAERVALHGALVAPDLLCAEVGPAGWRAVRMGLMRREQTSSCRRLSVATWASSGRSSRCGPARLQLWPRALAIAHLLDHPLPDCIYLALAESVARSVTTADRRLPARVTGTAWGASVRPSRLLCLRASARLGSRAAPVYGPGKR